MPRRQIEERFRRAWSLERWMDLLDIWKWNNYSSSNLLIVATIFSAYKDHQPFVIDDLEGTFWVFGHGDATSCENSIGSYGSKKTKVTIRNIKVSRRNDDKNSLSSGISILNVSLSPIRTVSTSLDLLSRMRILGGGASGALVILIISGSLIGIIPNVIFLEDMS